DVDLVRGPSQEQAPGRVAQDGKRGMAHGADDPAGHLVASGREPRVHRTDDVVELGQYVVGVVESTVGENVGFYPLEHAERPIRGAEPAVDAVDLEVLAAYRFDSQAAGVGGAPRMIAKAEVGPTLLASSGNQIG